MPELWSLHEGVQIELESSGSFLRVRSRWGNVTIRHPSEMVLDALYRMSLGPISLENVVGMPGPAPQADEPAPGAAQSGYLSARTQLERVLSRLQPVTIRSLGIETGQPLLSVVPMTARSRFNSVPVPLEEPVRLSTYAELRTNGDEYFLESPLSLYRVLLHGAEAISLLNLLSRPITAAEYIAGLPRLASVAPDVLAYLVAAGMVVKGHLLADIPVFSEDTDPALAGWSGVDLMFHTRRTLGSHDNAFGATYPRGSSGSPEPAVKPPLPGAGIPLHRPSWEELAEGDPPLGVVMEARRSMRSYGPEPVTAAELGVLLYRTARVRSLVTPPPDAEVPQYPARLGGPGEGDSDSAGNDPRLSNRPYPGGGAGYEIELYVTVGQCEGIPSAIYHYDPLGHRLELVNSDRAMVDELLTSASQAAVVGHPPPVLITMTARLGRLTWKYESIAYAVALMNLGVLIQSLYLVCTAMGLAPCALGSVRIDITARAFGTDWRLEPVMGQFMLGRLQQAPGGYAGRWEPVNDADWADLARARLRRPGPAGSLRAGSRGGPVRLG
jgi:SagB-type dehydrogenase family enzyme